MLLDWIARERGLELFATASRAIEQAVDTLLHDPARRTGDLGGPLGTTGFTEALRSEIGRRLG